MAARDTLPESALRPLLFRIIHKMTISLLPNQYSDANHRPIPPPELIIHPPPSPHPLPSKHPRKKPHQPLRAHKIPLPNQLRHVQIQRTVRLAAIRHELLDRLQRAHHTIRRSPFIFQQVQADLAGREGDVRVNTGGLEADGGRGGGVGGGEGDLEVEGAAWL